MGCCLTSTHALTWYVLTSPHPAPRNAALALWDWRPARRLRLHLASIMNHAKRKAQMNHTLAHRRPFSSASNRGSTIEPSIESVVRKSQCDGFQRATPIEQMSCAAHCLCKCVTPGLHTYARPGVVGEGCRGQWRTPSLLPSTKPRAHTPAEHYRQTMNDTRPAPPLCWSSAEA
jgi:hypothetical protein